MQTMSRRMALGTLGAFGATVLAPTGSLQAQQPPRIIDVHHHFNAPFLLGNNAGPWGIEKSIESMDRNGIATSVLSPATGFAEDRGAGLPALTRRVNEFGAEAVRSYPGRFGQFAFVPLPDIDAALAEIAYAFDVLKVNGIILTTNYGARYVSDPAFAPIFEELDRRSAVAYFHPRSGPCCGNLFPDFPVEENWLEIPYDTGRVVVAFLLSGAFRRFRKVKWLFAHSGGPIPILAGRIRNSSDRVDLTEAAPEGVDVELRRLYYETGNASSPATMAALLRVVPTSQVLFGSDHPYVGINANLRDLSGNNFPTETMNNICRQNALRVIPNLPH